MRYFLVLFSLLAINCSAVSVAKNYKHGQHITIEIIKPVNGYKISIVWFPVKRKTTDEIVGPANMELTNIVNKKKYTTHYESLVINCSIKDLKMEGDNVKSFSTSDFQISYDAMKDKPFYFFDFNFDGIKDLIISESGFYRNDQRAHNKFFEISPDGSITLVYYKPFEDDVSNFYIDGNEIGFRNGLFDVKNKEITVIDEVSPANEIDHIYHLNKNKNATENKFIEVRTVDHDYRTKDGYDIIHIRIPGKNDHTKIVKLKAQ